jgi:hypothetical protein
MLAVDLVQHIRNHVLRDLAQPVLWSNDELLLYLNDAESLFARRTHNIVDDTSDLGLLQVEAGKHTYTLNKKIIHVYEIEDEVGRPLKSRSRNQMPRVFGEGRPYAFTTGRGSKTVRLAPTPAEDTTFRMLVARMPEKPMVYEYDEPEIDEEYHLALCEWAVYRALTNNDPEGSETISAEPFLARWNQAISEAKREGFRLRTPTGATVRTNWTGARR